MTELVTSRTEGDVSVIRFDDGKANALSFEMLDGINAALDAAEVNSKAVVLIGREGKFSAGFDLTVMTGNDVDAVRRLLLAGATLGLRIFMSPVPVVLGVTGHALAQGGIIATCADYRVGADGPYKLGLNEVAIGMPMPRFGAELCRNRLTKKWFTRCVQHAELLNPTNALEANFLDEVVELDTVESRAIEVAAHLAATVVPSAFRGTRKNLRGALAEQIRVDLEADLSHFEVNAG